MGGPREDTISRQELPAGALDLISFPLGAALPSKAGDDSSGPTYGICFQVRYCMGANAGRQTLAQLLEVLFEILTSLLNDSPGHMLARSIEDRESRRLCHESCMRMVYTIPKT